MDINQIKLPPSLIAELFPHQLVQTEINKVEIGKDESPGQRKYLGDNRKNILIAVNYTDIPFLPDQQLQFLTNMLSACKLSLADVAIINIADQKKSDHKLISNQFQNKIALLFGVEPSQFDLPMNFPFYQVQDYSGCSYLYAPPLEELETDKVQKSKLWVVLRRIFNV